VVHIVWSPRRIEESLAAHEALGDRFGIDTAFIVGMNEHEGCAAANEIVRGSEADLFVLSYDDQIPTPEALACVLRHQDATGDVVSGWQVLGQDSPWAAAVYPSWGERPLETRPECFYQAASLRDPYALGGAELVPSFYFAALTAIPAAWLRECPIWASPSWVSGDALRIWPSRDGQPYDKGCCSDWTLAMDLHAAGRRIWVARAAEVRHLARQHNVPEHKFWIAEEDPGVHWGRRPR